MTLLLRLCRPASSWWQRINFSNPAAAPVQACLKLVAERETRYRVQWYYRLFEQTMRGLNRCGLIQTMHGCA